MQAKTAPYTCPRCKRSFPVPVKKQGEFYVFHPCVKCKECGKNVSKQFFASLIADQVKFRWDRSFVAKKATPKPAKKPRKMPKVKVIYTSEPPPKKPLNEKEIKAVGGFISGMSKKDALVSAGYSENTARGNAASVFGNPRIIEAIQSVMERKGLTLDTILPVLKEGLSATKVISAMVIAPDGEGMKDANSMTRDFVEVPDYKERRETVALSLKLLGYPTPEKKDEGAAGNEIPRTYEETRERLGLDRHTDIREAMREFFINLAAKRKAEREVREKAVIES
jgi:hypothetical protein